MLWCHRRVLRIGWESGRMPKEESKICLASPGISSAFHDTCSPVLKNAFSLRHKPFHPDTAVLRKLGAVAPGGKRPPRAWCNRISAPELRFRKLQRKCPHAG